MTQNGTLNNNGVEVFASTWGFHPCDYETFIKICKLRQHYQRSLREAKAWFVWARKAERNRRGPEPKLTPVFNELVLARGPRITESRPNAKMGYSTSLRSAHTKWLKSDKGESYIYDIPEGYMAEPVESKYGNYIRQRPTGPNHDKTVLVRSHAIEEAYQQARMPAESEDEVKPLLLPIGQIDAMLAEIEKS